MPLALDSRHPRQAGFALMECLFAILIFSVGILALLSLQATSIAETSAARYRTDASLLANRLVGEMWASNRATLAANFATGGTRFAAWKTDVAQVLPSGDATVTVAANPGLAGNLVTIRVTWKAPTEPAAAPVHNYTLLTQIGPP